MSLSYRCLPLAWQMTRCSSSPTVRWMLHTTSFYISEDSVNYSFWKVFISNSSNCFLPHFSLPPTISHQKAWVCLEVCRNIWLDCLFVVLMSATGVELFWLQPSLSIYLYPSLFSAPGTSPTSSFKKSMNVTIGQPCLFFFVSVAVLSKHSAFTCHACNFTHSYVELCVANCSIARRENHTALIRIASCLIVRLITTQNVLLTVPIMTSTGCVRLLPKHIQNTINGWHHVDTVRFSNYIIWC